MATLRSLLDSWTAVPVTRALVQMGVPESVPPTGSVTLQELAARVGADPGMLYRALRFVSVFGTFRECEDGAIAHTEDSLALLPGGALRDKVLFHTAPETVAPYFEGFIPLLKDPSKSAFEHLNGEDYFTQWLPKHPESEKIFGRFMSCKTEPAGFVKAYSWPSQGTIADIGGGNGHLLRAVLEKQPELRGILFDLPSTLANAKEHWPADDVMHSGRVQFCEGNFLAAVGVTADVYILRWILHDWSDDKCVTILSNISKSAPETSTLVVFDLVLPEGMANQTFNSTFIDVHMAALHGGKERTRKELDALAGSTGWQVAEVLPVEGEPWACCILKRTACAPA